MQKINLQLQTLTPLWTGGVETGKMQRIHESGILGSLRWWYEAIVRGLGGDVCDPTSDKPGERCPQEVDGRKTYCPVCELFGATGMRRGFRLTLAGGEHLFDSLRGDTRIHIVAPDGNTGWYLGEPFIATDNQPIRGSFLPLRDANTANKLTIIVALIDAWGGLGPRTQHGWGVVQTTLKDSQDNAVVPEVEAFIRQFPGDQKNDKGFPSLTNMFFARLYLRNDLADDWWNAQESRLWQKISPSFSNWTHAQGLFVPTTHAIKYKLRFYDEVTVHNRTTVVSKFLALDDKNGYREKTFFGNTQEPRAAMLNISNAYKENGRWQFRIWGWLPTTENNAGIDRNALLTAMHRLVTQDTNFWDSIFGKEVIDLTQTVWRELDNTGHGRNRPAYSTPPYTPADFLRCLLIEEQ